jgi:23S rRNA pseudouridine2605 synthase
MRLQSFLAHSGVASRRNVLDEIEAGKVKVNGDIVRIPSYPIFPETDKVLYEDKEVKLEEKIYFIFHKPRGVITTAEDTHGRKTVLDYFKKVPERLYPVGRLDQDTTGLLILTNDGDLANRLTHPRYGVQKVYEANLNKEITKAEIETLEKGVEIDGEKTAPCQIKLMGANFGKSKVEIVLHEGKKRQIRRMFESIGYQVVHLHRKFYGGLNLKGLAPGQSRPLVAREIEALIKLGGGASASDDFETDEEKPKRSFNRSKRPQRSGSGRPHHRRRGPRRPYRPHPTAGQTPIEKPAGNSQPPSEPGNTL